MYAPPQTYSTRSVLQEAHMTQRPSVITDELRAKHGLTAEAIRNAVRKAL